MNIQRMAVVAIASFLSMAGTAPAQWLNYPSPGTPRLRNGKPNLRAPTPLMANEKPDLSGIWATECEPGSECFGQRSLFFDLAIDLKPSDVEMTPWAAGIAAQRESRDHVDDPMGYCLPAGVPRVSFVGTFKILPTPLVTAFLYEAIPGPLFRQVFTDGRPLPTVNDRTWMGYSIGRWDDDTFVVETIGFRDGGWLDTRRGRPHSDALHVTERYRRTDFGHMEFTITIDDPKAYRKPWTVKTALHLLPDTDLLEAFCDTHEKTMEHRRITPPPAEPPSVAPPR
jgi:hypothetical protein